MFDGLLSGGKKQMLDYTMFIHYVMYLLFYLFAHSADQFMKSSRLSEGYLT